MLALSVHCQILVRYPRGPLLLLTSQAAHRAASLRQLPTCWVPQCIASGIACMDVCWFWNREPGLLLNGHCHILVVRLALGDPYLCFRAILLQR